MVPLRVVLLQSLTGKAGIYFVYGIVTIDDIQSADYIIAGISLNGGEPGTARRGTFATAGKFKRKTGFYC